MDDEYEEDGPEQFGGFLAFVDECPGCGAAVLSAGEPVTGCSDHNG